MPPDVKTTQYVCSQRRDVVRAYNCRDEFRTWTSCNDGVCTQHAGTSQVCDREYGPYYQVCQDHTTQTKWYGCVGSRDYPYNIRDDSYVIKPVPGLMNISCSTPITELSTSRPIVLKAIDQLSASGETYIPSGLMCGWAVLSQAEPFDEQTDKKNGTRRFIVLMSDGANTASPTYPKHDSNDAALADKLTSEICTNAKADGIEIFTIALAVDSASAGQLLRNCAISTDKHFDLANSGELEAAFSAIANQMSQLRLTR